VKATKSPRDWVVVLDGSHAAGTATYLGEVDRGVRQGVRRLANATRFTRAGAGAGRVIAGYPIDVTAGHAYAAQLTRSEIAPQGPQGATRRADERRVPSIGHLAWLDDGSKEAYEQGGEVYLAPTSYPINMGGHRQGARWECSIGHWHRHYDELWKPRVSP
jgi:hypothetical protein